MPDVSPIRVPKDFSAEFPGASPSAAESGANLVRAADAFLTEVNRRRRSIADLSASAFETLAILDGAGEPLSGHVIAERLLVTSASMTSILDTLERRGLVWRSAHPTDRRKVLIHLADEAREIVDRMLPSVHRTATEAFADLTEQDRETLVTLLATVSARLGALSHETPPEPPARRRPKGARRDRG